MSGLNTARAISTMLWVVSLSFGLIQWGQAGWIYAKANLANHLIDSAWERTLLTPQTPHKPWRWADTWPVATLRWQGQGVTEQWKVLANANGESLAFGPSLVAQGQTSPETPWRVVAAHRDTHFKALKTIKALDRLSWQTPDGTWSHYEVTHTEIRHADTAPLLFTEDDQRLVLTTCYPFNAVSADTPYRFVVYASLIKATPQFVQQTAKTLRF